MIPYDGVHISMYVCDWSLKTNMTKKSDKVNLFKRLAVISACLHNQKSKQNTINYTTRYFTIRFRNFHKS